MTIEPLSEVKTRLSEYVRRATHEHERTTITVNGRAEAVIINAEDLEILEETLYWTSQPDWRDTLREAQRDIAAGNVSTTADVLADLEHRQANGE